ncbi:MAG: excinuclease ABC subunit A, partial [Gemmatimonadetes bacterium]|nr:excinuclease ABC subunit A [Gemmatimonadota bacterium]NIR79944.1 excinuclease ABC subunit A [Gemmatimonadota bacterium]NIT89006.1 excinuclease ABC subunit A [Gemmatimonadota bacterium]NIU32479.1 excinuclease ABC subunit A [Gemmatimonadota bacterium]NIV62843.1 excinuclease ABC subunit A [Gemmatimonadota bacterium]
LVVVDRLKVSDEVRDRLADSLGTAFSEGEGEAVVLVAAGGEAESDGREAPERLAFTEHFRCPRHPEVDFLDPSPQLFSFNNPYGSCPECTGFGATLEYDLELIVPNPERSIDDGAVDPWTKPRYDEQRDRLRAFAREDGVSVYTPWKELPEAFREEVLYGTEEFQGIVPFLKSREKKRYKRY